MGNLIARLLESDKGVEVWEVDTKSVSDVLDNDMMLRMVRARKWVHEDYLMDLGQRRVFPNDSPDKVAGGLKLGVTGERIFAPMVGRAGDMKDTEPGVRL